MDEPRRYKVIYTEAAAHDIEEKADYITVQFRDMDLAEKWYRRLREAIQERVSTFPKKYALYDRGSSKEKGVRLFDFRNDVILYTVDEATLTVYILAVCTKGRDLDRHLLETESETFPS